MLDNLYHKISTPKKVLGLDIIHHQDDSYQITAIALQLEKNNITVLDNWESNDIAQALGKIDKELPVFINLSGKGVLTKKVVQNNFSLNQLLPNLKIEDFYTQQTAQHISVMRKEQVDALCKQCEDEGVSVIGVSLNGFPIQNIQLVLDAKKDKIATGNSSYLFEDGQITALEGPQEESSENMMVGGERIAHHQLVSYSIALQVLVHQIEIIQITQEEIRELGEEYQQKKLFKTGSMALLGGVLALLLINFMLFSLFRNTHQSLNNELGLYEGQIKKIEALKNEVNHKNSFLTKTGWLNPSKTSFYADQLGNTVPKSIQLSQLVINPVDKKETKKQKETTFANQLIQISGTTNSSITLNAWIKQLKKITWVSTAEVLNYEQKPGNRQAEFTLEVLLQ